jgi:hypothetical protein
MISRDDHSQSTQPDASCGLKIYVMMTVLIISGMSIFFDGISMNIL